MPQHQTDEAKAFFHAVYSAVSEVPSGRVTTYGHIAALIGTPQRPRQVGICLKHLPNDPTTRWNNTTVPWQRIVNAKGVISPRNHPTAVRTQAERLRDEGVTVTNGALGEMSVDLGEYGWFPTSLPSEDDDTTSDDVVKKEEEENDDDGGDNVEIKEEQDD